MSRRVAATFAFALLLLATSLSAGSRFVRGGSDGINTFAVVERNGIEFRTDQLGARVNSAIWSELSAADRKALIKAYGWEIGRRIDDFGKTTSDEMAAWIDNEQGWTAAADALKARHATKAFPALTALFGPGTALEIPDFACGNPEVINSAEYKEASRLALEIQYDDQLGRALYGILTNAKWDQVCVSVKALSEELIKVIVDNFMTGAITNGAAKTSELVAQALDPLKDKIRDWLLSQKNSGAAPKSATEMIAELEKMIGEIEDEADAAAIRVTAKKSRLADLATILKQRCDERTQAKKDAARAVRDALIAQTQTIPGPLAPPAFVPRNPEATPAEQQIDIGLQAQAWLQTYVYAPMSVLSAQKSEAVGEVTARYGPAIAGRWVGYPGGGYFADASDGFSRSYFEVMDKLSDVNTWVGTDIPKTRNDATAAADKLAGAPADVSAVLDAQLPQIALLDARNRGMDAYAAQLGYVPSTSTSFAGLRNYLALIDVAATTDLTSQDLATEYRDHATIADMVATALPSGVSKRQQWMATQASHYEDLRFNWENSISYVVAALRQIDRLHSGPYFKRDAYPFTCYGEACLYRYAIDIDGIKASISSEPTVEARERARVAAVRELVRLRNEESRLLQKLEIAQRSHVNDKIDLKNFFDALYSRYHYPADARGDFSSAGFQLRDEDDLYTALVPDSSYYVFGDGSWLRNRGNLQTNTQQAIELVSGKIPEYYELLNLYQSMDVEKSKYLAMSLSEFDAFMTSTTTKLMNGGTYPTAFQIAGVYGVDWPCWQLLMKTQARQEELNSLYRGYPPPAKFAWDIDGWVTTTGGTAFRSGATVMKVPAAEGTAIGVGVPDVDVILSGYLTASTRTDSSGHFRFTWIGAGAFTAAAASPNYYFDQPTNNVTMVSADVSTNFSATETPASGYFLMGIITDTIGAPLQGISVALTSTAGTQQQVTGADGRFTFTGVPLGEIQITPVSDAFVFTPPNRAFTLNGSMDHMDFIAAPGAADEPQLSVTVSGGGTVTSVPAGINCPPDCAQSYAKNTVVDLTATPDAESKFNGWHGACGGTDTCHVTMAEIRSVSAEFDSRTPADTTPPTITAFSAPATSGSTIAITFAATDNVGVTGYLVTTSTAQPIPGDARWSAWPQSSVAVTGSGTFTLYGWARDSAGNTTVSAPAVVRVTQTAFSGAAPAAVAAAAASPCSVSISWSPVTGATSYLVERRGPGESFRVIASVGDYWFTDTTAAAGTAYLYRIKASGEGRYSAPSVADLATTVIFEDSPLTAGILVRAVHLGQLRTAVNAVRQVAGLSLYSFTDPAAAGAPIRAIHFEELRTALDQARGPLGLPTGSYTDASLSGATIKAIHIQELRDRMR